MKYVTTYSFFLIFLNPSVALFFVTHESTCGVLKYSNIKNQFISFKNNIKSDFPNSITQNLYFIPKKCVFLNFRLTKTTGLNANLRLQYDSPIQLFLM